MMRVAMLAHSTNPRGGVVHAMSLSDAFAEVGVEAVLHAPDATGLGFFRASRGRSVAFPVAPAAPGFADMIEQRIGDYVAWFRTSHESRLPISITHTTGFRPTRCGCSNNGA